METVKVKMEDRVVAKRLFHGPDFLVTQFVLRPGRAAIENQVLGLAVCKSQSLHSGASADILKGSPWVGLTECCP